MSLCDFLNTVLLVATDQESAAAAKKTNGYVYGCAKAIVPALMVGCATTSLLAAYYIDSIYSVPLIASSLIMFYLGVKGFDSFYRESTPSRK